MNPKIKDISEDNNIFKFTLFDINVSLANAVRRIILNDINTVVLRTETYGDNMCIISVNTGRLHNEFLKQRISCIPIHSTKLDELPNNYILEISEKNESDSIMYVTTEHFKIKSKETGEYMEESKVRQIFPIDIASNQYIDFCRLRPKIGDIPGEEIKLTCEFSIANAGVSSMFNVVSKCAYGNTIDTKKRDNAWEEKKKKMQSKGLPDEEIEFAKTNFYILDAQQHYIKDSFDFAIETVGVYENRIIVKMASDIMKHKIETFKQNIEDNKVKIIDSLVTMENSWDIILENEDYTLGKALEFYLYESFYNKKLHFCAFKKLHPHDSTSRIRVAYKNKVSPSDICTDLKEACDKLNEIYSEIKTMF